MKDFAIIQNEFLSVDPDKETNRSTETVTEYALKFKMLCVEF